MKFIKEGFRGVPNGEIYAHVFAKGDECPKELEKAALEQGYLKQAEKKAAGVAEKTLFDEKEPELESESGGAVGFVVGQTQEA